MGLPMQEVALLGRVEVAAEDLLARCLESYYALSEAALGDRKRLWSTEGRIAVRAAAH